MVLPAVIYMDQHVAKYFTYATWKMFKAESVIPQFFPPKIDDMYRNMNLGLFQTIAPKLKDMIKTRYKYY